MTLKSRQKTRVFQVGIIALFVGGMGVTLPSCPSPEDQEAQKQQLQSMQASLTESTNKLRAVEAQLAALKKDVDSHKGLIDTLGQQQVAQKASLDGIETMVKEVDVKVTQMSTRSSPSAKRTSLPAAKKPAPKRR
jgi:septal ring factor EnvC (AmiA/AmiB activator)